MNYWAGGGKYIGRRSGNYLYSKNGDSCGIFYGNELYDFSGKCGCSYCDYAGYVMLCSCEDFKFE